jgi:hypothetical protein
MSLLQATSAALVQRLHDSRSRAAGDEFGRRGLKAYCQSKATLVWHQRIGWVYEYLAVRSPQS